jgi:hypothetical protein
MYINRFYDGFYLYEEFLHVRKNMRGFLINGSIVRFVFRRRGFVGLLGYIFSNFVRFKGIRFDIENEAFRVFGIFFYGGFRLQIRNEVLSFTFYGC